MTSSLFALVLCPERAVTINVLGVARSESLSFRVKEYTEGRRKESSTTPPCEQAVRSLLYMHVSVNRKFSKARRITRKQKDSGILGQTVEVSKGVSGPVLGEPMQRPA